MPASDRGGLKAAFSNFKRPDTEQEAEIRLLGRTAEGTPNPEAPAQIPGSYPAGTQVNLQTPSHSERLIPRPLVQKEAVRQLSFRCPVSLAAELRKKAAYNQLEQQEIITEGIRRVLAELPEPPAEWTGY
jgi:hypothetical protein